MRMSVVLQSFMVQREGSSSLCLWTLSCAFEMWAPCRSMVDTEFQWAFLSGVRVEAHPSPVGPRSVCAQMIAEPVSCPF